MNIIKPFGKLPELIREEYNNNFVPFVSIPNLFNNNEIDKIRALWNEDEARDAKIGSLGSGEINYQKRKSRIIFLDKPDTDWIYDRLSMACILVNANKYKFDILGYQSKLQLTSYGVGDFFGWHMDSGDKHNSIRKLSITVQLTSTDEYEGGALQFFKGNDTINAPSEKGTAVIFPSYVAHRVEPVTKGCRKSIVGWIAGPPYR
jgi:PKHD-type hydroxylase